MADISKITLPTGSTYDLISKKTRGLYRGVFDSTSTSTAYTATVDGIIEYYDGLTLSLLNPVVASAAGCTININNLGAKTIWASQQHAAVTTGIVKDAEYLFTFDGVNDRWIKQEGTQTTNLLTNLVDGSVTGSVRTAGSAAEDSSYTIGEYAVAEGNNTKASGERSHAEGTNTQASGVNSHAEGTATKAQGVSSHAEGVNTTASGYYSHVEGSASKASGYYSHAEGLGTIATSKSQHVFGEYNSTPGVNGTSIRGTYVEIVGNGTTNAPSNARTLDWSGNETLAGKLTLGAAPTANMDAATKQYVDNSVVTYSLSISGNRITLTPSSGTASYVDLPVYNGGVS